MKNIELRMTHFLDSSIRVLIWLAVSLLAITVVAQTIMYFGR